MNLQQLTDVALLQANSSAENIKTFDEYMANLDTIKEATKQKAINELGFKNPINKIKKIKKLSRKNYDLGDCDFRELTSSEKKQRADIRKRTQELLVNKIPQKAAINEMCTKFIDKTSFREGSALISSFSKDENEAKEIIDFFNTTRTEENKKQYDREQAKLGKWLDDHIQKMIDHVDFFSTYKNEDELLEYAKENYDDVFAMVELQGAGILTLAKQLNIPVNKETADKFMKVSQFAVDISGEVISRLGFMASDLYTEMHEEDYYSLPLLATRLVSERLIDGDETNFLVEKKSNDPKYSANYASLLSKSTSLLNSYKGRRLDGMVGEQAMITKSNLEDGLITKEEYDQQMERYKNDIPTAFGKNSLIESMNYLKENKLGNPQNISYYLDGKQLNEDEAFKAAVSGKYVQMFNKTTKDGVEKEELLMSFRTVDASMCRPDLIGRSLKVEIDKAAEFAVKEAKASKANPLETSVKVTQAVQSEIKNTLTELYSSLKEGSRWYISSKGDYGTLMNNVKEAMNAKIENQAEKFAAIKEQAEKYLISRAKEKTNRTELSTLRESKVYQALETIKNVENQVAVANTLGNISSFKEQEVENKGNVKVQEEVKAKENNESIVIEIKDAEKRRGKKSSLEDDDIEINNDGNRKENFDFEGNKIEDNSIKEEDEELEDDKPIFKKEDQSFNKEVLQGNNPDSKIKEPSKKKIEDPKIEEPK